MARDALRQFIDIKVTDQAKVETPSGVAALSECSICVADSEVSTFGSLRTTIEVIAPSFQHTAVGVTPVESYKGVPPSVGVDFAIWAETWNLSIRAQNDAGKHLSEWTSLPEALFQYRHQLDGDSGLRRALDRFDEKGNRRNLAAQRSAQRFTLALAPRLNEIMSAEVTALDYYGQSDPSKIAEAEQKGKLAADLDRNLRLTGLIGSLL